MQSMPTVSFGELLRAFRKRQKLTQQELAERLSLHRNTVGTWELGEFLPSSRGMVLELARQLRLSDIETRQLLDASLLTHVPIWNIPRPRNPFFTGRGDTLDTLHQRLLPGKEGGIIQSHALYGLGGLGKTQIAIEYAYRYALSYSAIFWIRAESHETIIPSFLTIGRLLNLEASQQARPETAIAAVQNWLRIHDGWLLIWDNVEHLELVAPYLPSTPHGSTLITTRHQALGTLAQGIELHVMDQEEGLFFLLRRARALCPEGTGEHSPEYTAARAVVASLGGLPLALDQAGAYLEETGCTVADYLQRYSQQRTQLLDRRGLSCGDHPDSVTTTFLLATRHVERNPLATDLLRLCAFLHADTIPQELLGADYLASCPLSSSCTLDATHLDQAIATLRSFSLLQRHPETGTLSLHRLVQIVVQEEMTAQEFHSFQQRAIHLLHAAFPAITAETWTHCERLLPNILACAATVQKEGETREFTDLLCKTADYLLERALYREAEPLYQRVLCMRTQILGTLHPDVAYVLNNLATLSYRQGKYAQAETLYQQALHIREQTLGPQHPDVASPLNNLAILSYEQGKYEQAEGLYHRALHIWEHMEGPEHHRLAQVLYGLANLYSEQGKYEQAESFYHRALSISEQRLGMEHPHVAYPLNGLAFLYYEQGKYEQAEPLYHRALHIREQALGPQHPLLASVLNNLGHLYFHQQSYEQAEPLYHRALHIREQALGPQHPDVASPLNNLAILYTEQGKYDQAEALFQRTLHIRERHFGQQHPDTARSLVGLARLLKKQGRKEQARSLLLRACSIFEHCFGHTHGETQNALNEYQDLQEQEEKAVTAFVADDHVAREATLLGQDAHPARAGSRTVSEETNGQDRDPLEAFLETCCQLHPLAWSSARDLWQAYTRWVEENQQRFSLSRRAFTKHLKARGCQADRTKTARIWRGIALVPGSDDSN